MSSVLKQRWKFLIYLMKNVEGYQKKCLLLSKSHLFIKQAFQRQSQQGKELAKVTEVQKIHFWEDPWASFHEANAAHGELQVKALNGTFYHSKALVDRAVLLHGHFSTSRSTAEQRAQDRLTSDSKDKRTCQASCSLSSRQFH